MGRASGCIGFSAEEHPVALQLGGSEPEALAEAAAIAADFGYDEINLNVGCPSDRVKSGAFGACLMLEPRRVGDCVAAIKAAVRIPVTVKCRIGVDDQEPEAALFALTSAVAAAGVDGLFVHARKAWLKGLSPRENRDVPPLDYPLVYRLKAAWPTLPIAVNGGIATLAEAKDHLEHVDGVMLGRAAYRTPGTAARRRFRAVRAGAACARCLRGIFRLSALCRGPARRGRAPRRYDGAAHRPVFRARRRACLSSASLDRGGRARGGQ